MSVNSKMTAIADAIREKTGKTEPLTLAQMATEIAGIQTVGGDVAYNSELCSMYAEKVTVGENTISNASQVNDYFHSVCKGEDLVGLCLTSEPKDSNQFIFWMAQNGQTSYYRFRNGVVGTGQWPGSGYDAKLTPGTEYVVLSATKPIV